MLELYLWSVGVTAWLVSWMLLTGALFAQSRKTPILTARTDMGFAALIGFLLSLLGPFGWLMCAAFTGLFEEGVKWVE